MNKMESVKSLRDETVQALEDLVRVNLDSYQNLVQVHGASETRKLVDLFRELAEQRKSFAAELGSYVYLNDGDTNPSGSFLEGAHRWWLDLTGKLERGDALVILDEAERGEAIILEAYEKVIRETEGNAVSDVLNSHRASIRNSLDRVRALRKRLESASEE